MVFLDASLLAALMLLGSLVTKLAPALTSSALLIANASKLWYVLLLIALYALILLALYSLVKLLALHFTALLFEPKAIDFSRYFGFLGLNLMMFLAFGAFYAFLAYFIASIRQPYAAIVFLLITIPYLILFFISLMSAQTHHHHFKKGPFQSFIYGSTFPFSRFSLYRPLLGYSLLFTLGFFLLLFLIGLGIKQIASLNYGLYAASYGYFSLAVSILSPLIAYLLILFNRIGFYLALSEEKQHDRP